MQIGLYEGRWIPAFAGMTIHVFNRRFNLKIAKQLFRSFGHSNFEFVSYFDIRISDLI